MTRPLARRLAALERSTRPVAQEATELLRRGLRLKAESVLDAALEGMAGPDDGSGLGWFDPRVKRDVA
jgi:hypothetical protein